MMQLANNIELQQGKYKIIRVLGQGGFGITYLAKHTLLDKCVAIKEFFPKEYCDRAGDTSNLSIGTKSSEQLVEALKIKFVKEAKNISKLHHPNIITIHDIFLENNTAYYVMEYVEGASLLDKIKQCGHLDEKSAVEYIKKIANAVGYMHSLFMNHLDLKPANIMVRKEDGEPILIDFGLSKQYDASGGQTSTTPVGISHGYAPIEQYRPGGVTTFTPQTDIYALGATLYALITGNTPPHYSVILEDGFPEITSVVSQQTIEAIKAAMEIKKANRPTNIDAFLKLLGEEPSKNTIESDPIQELNTSDQEDIIKSDSKPNEPIMTHNNSEETVILNMPELSESLNKKCHQHKTDEHKQKTERKAPQFENKNSLFIDLGLSVCWAKRTSGVAIPSYDADVYEFKLNDGNMVSPLEFESSNLLPTTKDFEELLERCSWMPFSDNGINGYKIVGPNGNILIMPLSSLNRYLSSECLKPNCAYYYSLYLGEYTHTLAKGVPTAANLWTVRRKE
jgi:serine/threonine protein kinase